MDAKSVRCTKCVLPERTSGIHFDNEGVCNYCHSYPFRTVKGEKPLLEIFRQHSASGTQKYDRIAPVSGGRDSTFLLWKLVNDYKMRPLAVHYDNPFSSEQASRNLEKSTQQLGVDLLKWTFPDKPLHEKETRKALKVWSRRPSASMLTMVCSVCKSWWPTFLGIARKKEIPLIVIGSNAYESASFKEASFGSARTYFRLNHLPKTIVKGFTEIAKNPGYLTCSWPSAVKMCLMASHSSPIVRMLYKDVKVVRMFDYIKIKWNKSEVLNTITQNLGWKKDPDHPSTWRFDCRLDHIKKFLYKQLVGVSELEDLMSKFIREGMVTREAALARLEKEDTTPLNLVEQLLSQINLKVVDLNWPKKWLTDNGA